MSLAHAQAVNNKHMCLVALSSILVLIAQRMKSFTISWKWPSLRSGSDASVVVIWSSSTMAATTSPAGKLIPHYDNMNMKELIIFSCGQEFCYSCGQAWRTCDCQLWDENNLFDMANELVDADEGVDEDEEALPFDHLDREVAFNHILEELRQHEDIGCDHHRYSQWAWRNHGSLQCEVCNQYLPRYIFLCRNCRMRVCNRCRRHRLR